MSTPSFWGGLGTALEQYEASKSPLGAAAYYAATGQQLPSRPGAINNPAMAVANSIIAKYRRGATGPTPAAAPGTAQPVQPKIGQPQAAPIALGPTNSQSTQSAQTRQDVGIGPAPSSSLNLNISPAVSGSSVAAPTPINANPGASLPNGTYGSGGVNSNTSFPGTGVNSTGDNNANGGFGDLPYQGAPGIGTSDSTVAYNPVDYSGGGTGGLYDNGDGSGGGGGYSAPVDENSFALGGVAGGPTMARVAESGPEVAGGQVVTSPSIVKLNKGEAVIPLTPRANNKLQPDLMVGHVSTPQEQGMHFSRYKSYGQGRSLMR